MDKLTKFLNQRTKAEQKMLILGMKLIIENKLQDLDIKKLRGQKDLFRTRIGKFRIIFRKFRNENQILKIDIRNDRTYSNY